MPTQSLQHNTPTFSTRNINANSTNSLPNPYNSPILASDLMAFPAGGVKNANTLDELRRALNQVAKDNKAYLDGLQVQVTNNDGDITIIDTNLTEIQADLVNVARDLSRKAWESIIITAGVGLRGGGSIAADRTVDLNVSSPGEIGGVLSSNETIAETIGTSAENAINGHIEVTSPTGYMKVKNNAVELGVKTRGDYIKNITALPADGITLTNGTGEGSITDLKLSDIHSGASEQLATVTDANITGHSMPNGKIRRVTLHVPTRDKFGRITSDSPLKINSANDKNLKVLVTDGLNITAGNNLGASTSKSATFKQNKGSNQDFTINHSPAVSTLADTTVTTGIPSSGYSNYSPGFNSSTQGGANDRGKINFPETLQALTFDTFGHVKQVTKRTLTYGLDSPLTPINSSTEPYTPGGGSGYDLNIPTEADFGNLVERVLTLQGNRVLIPDGGANIQIERDCDVTGATGGSGTLNVNGNLNVGTIGNASANILKVDTSTQRVGINLGTSSADRELNVLGRVKIDAGSTASMGGTIDNGYLVISSDTRTLGIDPNQIRTDDDLILQAPGNNKSIQLETAAGTVLKVTSGGRVGIGTTGPVKTFQVVGANDNSVSASFSGGIEVGNTVNTVSGGNRAFGFLSIDNDRTMVGGNLRLDDSVTAGSHPGYAAGTNDRGGAGIVFENSNDNSPGEIRFVQKGDTNDGTWDVVETMIIDQLGRVGIGTSTPAARLHVKAPTPGNSNIQGSTNNTIANSPSAIFDTTVVCEGNLVVKGDFNLQNGITFDNWNLADTTGDVTADGVQHFRKTTDSSSATTGAVKIDGGVGIAKNLNVGNNTQLGNASGDTVGMGSNQLVFGQMGPDNTYGIAYGGGVANQSDILDDSPNGDRWRMYQSHRLPNPTAAGVANESIHNDGVTYTTGAQDYLVFEKQDGNQQSMDGGFVFISNGFEDDNDTTQAKKHFRIRNTDAKFYQNLEVAGTSTFTSAATFSNNLNVNGTASFNGNTNLGNGITDTTTISGNFTAGASQSAERQKLFFDSDSGRLGLGETTPQAHFSTGSKIDVASLDSGISELVLRGHGQGAGRLYVGQSMVHGGGIQYEGEKDNRNLGIGTEDHIQFFRRSTGGDQLVFEYSQAHDGGIKMNMDIVMAGGTASKRNISGVNQITAATVLATGALEGTQLTKPTDTGNALVLKGGGSNAANIELGDASSAQYIHYDAVKHIFRDRDTVPTALVIDSSNGLVGIGTGAPTSTLEVVNTGETKLAIRTSGTGDAVLQLCEGSSAESNADWTIRLDNDSENKLSFRHDNNTRMTLTTAGRLGLGTGTTAPGYTLDMAGNQRLKSTVPEIVFHETDQTMSTGQSGGRYRLIGNNGEFRISRNTHASSQFSSQEDAFKVQADGDLLIGSKSISGTGSTNHVPIVVVTSPTAQESHYIQTNVPRFICGSENLFTVDGRSSSSQRLSFATRVNGADVPIRSAQDGTTNYTNDNNPGDGNTDLGFVVRNIDGADRGTIIYNSRTDGANLILNTNEAGDVIHLNHAGVQTARFDINKDGNKFGLVTPTTGNMSDHDTRIGISGAGNIYHYCQSVFYDESNSKIDGDPGAVLRLRSQSADHLRFEAYNGSHLGTIDFHETNGMYIECNTGTATAKVIRLRPDNADRLTITSSYTQVLNHLWARKNGTHYIGDTAKLTTTNPTILSVEGAIRAARIPSNAASQASEYAFNLDANGNIVDVGSITSDSTIQGNKLKAGSGGVEFANGSVATGAPITFESNSTGQGVQRANGCTYTRVGAGKYRLSFASTGVRPTVVCSLGVDLVPDGTSKNDIDQLFFISGRYESMTSVFIEILRFDSYTTHGGGNDHNNVAMMTTNHWDVRFSAIIHN